MDLIIYKAMHNHLNHTVEEVTETILETFYQCPCTGGTLMWVEWKDTLPNTPGHVHAHITFCKFCGDRIFTNGLPNESCGCDQKEDWAGDRYIIDFPATYLNMSFTEIITAEQKRIIRNRPDPPHSDLAEQDPGLAGMYRGYDEKIQQWEGDM